MPGPADLPVALLIAARRGDQGAFAQFVEQGDVHVRPFVYLTLAGDGSTDRVLAATYVRAYRALPRYRPAHSPALWLHRVAYLVSVDELRRLSRDPMRRQPRPNSSPSRPTRGAAPVEPEEPDATVATLRHLAPDQRALAAMVDLEGFHPAAVADTFGTAPEVIAARLASARRVLAPVANEAGAGAGIDVVASTGGRKDPAGVLGGPTTAGEGAEPPVAAADDSFAVPVWARDEPAPALGALAALDQGPATAAAVPADLADPDLADPDPPDPDPLDLDEAHLAGPVHRVLADVTVPPPDATFWVDLGRRLLAERDRPAARTPNPAARLVRTHPAEPSFVPATASIPPSGAVSTLADRAHQNRPRRRRRRPLLITAAVIIVAGVVAGAVALGVSGRRPDGSATGGQLAATLAETLGASPYLTVDATVDLPGPEVGATLSQPYRLTLGDDGSWAATRTDAFDRATFDSSIGLARRLVAVPDPAGGGADVQTTESDGLAAGAPDTVLATPDPLADLRAVGTLLRAEGDRRASVTGEDDAPSWTYQRTVTNGPVQADELWRVTIDQASGLPSLIERRSSAALVRRVRFTGWESASTAPADTFRQTLPETPNPSPSTTSIVTADGFVTTDLAGVAILGRGQAVTPAWLPQGFELAAVAVRGEAPVGQVSTGAGTNPPDEDVISLGYQRGPERITITTRATTAPATDWTDPFVVQPGQSAAIAAPVASPTTVRRRTLGDGRYNQVPVQVGTDAVGRAYVWGVDDDTVFTVGGDLTAADAYRVAASLR